MTTIKSMIGMAVLAVALAVASANAAQEAVLEVEPNETPQTATAFQGPSLLLGDMTGTDQDAFLWTVSDVDAGRRWNFELQGIAGALTIMEVARITYNDAGETLAADRLFKLGSRDGSRPAFANDLIFEPGEYLLGLASAGGGSAPYRPGTASLSFGESTASDADESSGGESVDTEVGAYRVSLTQGPYIPGTPKEPHASPDSARPLGVERELAGFLETAETWYRIDLTEEQSTSRWDFRAQAPIGRTIETTLRTADGETLTRARSESNGAVTLADIAQPAGVYYVTVKPLLHGDEQPGFLHTLIVTEVGQRVAGSEAEPNDSWKLANRADFDGCCSGRMGSDRDQDFFVFTFEESRTDQLHTLSLETDDEQSMMLCLLDDRGQQIQCRHDTGGVKLGDLLLQPGDYGVRVQSRGAGEGTEYRLSFTASGLPDPGREAEPNDSRPYASAMPANHRIRGRFDGQDDVDHYKFVIPGEAQLWRFQVIGDGIGRIEYSDAKGLGGQIRQVRSAQRRVTLDNQFLLPGTHYVSVHGRVAGDYTLLARPLGPPDPNGEMEPNDDLSRMQPLRFGQTRTGLLSDLGDVDMYRFYLADWDHIELTATPPPDGQLSATLIGDGGQPRTLRETTRAGIEGPVVLSGVFPPGDYKLALKPLKTSDAEYRLSLERKDRFTCPADCEPNDNIVFASEFPPGRVVSGRSGEWGDYDWYRLPRFPVPQRVALHYEADAYLNPEFFQRIYYEYVPTKLDFEVDRANNTATGVLPADADTYLRVGSNRIVNYTITLLLDDETAPPEPLPALPVTLALSLEGDEVAAYERVGQRLAGELALENLGDAPLELTLEAAVSDARWQVDFASAHVSLAANSRRTVAVDVIVRPDAWADIPVRVGTRAFASDGRQVSAVADVRVGRNALAVNPVHAWNIPQALRGGFNVARSQFGGSVESEPKHLHGPVAHLIDGMTAISTGPDWGHRNEGSPLQITVDLAGDDPVPVAGFALNPLHANYTSRTPRNVEFELSMDGVDYTRVLSGTLDTVGIDQYFVLEAPVPARYARLVADDNWYGEIGRPLTLGEFKVITEPGFDPFGGEGINLADAELGGHVVWSRPGISVGWDHAILTDTEENPHAGVPADEPFEWVVAFHNNRAAQIESIDLRTNSKGNIDLDEIAVSTSLESPVGPWEPVAAWSRADSGDTLELDAPAWVRFLKFTVPAAETDRAMRGPETLIVRERATDEVYRSALSEWGFRSRSAYYESTQPAPLRPRLAQRGNESRATAHPLDSDQVEAGQVELGKQTQWYRPALPAAHNALTFTITGDPTVRTDLVLTDTQGNVIPLRKREQESTVSRHIFDAYAEPGQSTVVEVREPERNVLFLWDTSASTLAYHSMIYNSLVAYAEDLVPGRDAANLMPFGHSAPLMRDWYSEPHLLQLVLNEFPRRGSSSSAEGTLASATKALAPRSGTKAIVVLTDAYTPQHRPMWDSFKEVRPRIFSLKVPSGRAPPGLPELEQDLMQDWADVNGGHYSYLAHEGEMEVAYDRAATLLRRPANYTLTLTTEAREPPGPGSLRVTAGADGDGAVAGAAVELILDASGSMLQRMDGRRRIDVAREVLTSVVREHLPAGTPTALRVYGHHTPNACETDLVIPLGPLDPDAAAETLAGITAMNLARTPIAASLAAVPRDLGDAGKSGALIVLVTDGEETCDGDSLAEIERLKAAGLDVSLNIIGFAIDDQALADQFTEWAAAGGGRYFAANDAEGLAESVAQALALPYKVYDADGDVVVAGVVDGDAVELAQGVYRVVVGGSVSRTFSDVEIASESDVTLTLQPSE